MPKLKTNKGAAKRFKTTGTGKIKRNKPFASHLLTAKTSKRKMRLRHSGLIEKVDEKMVKRLIPHA